MSSTTAVCFNSNCKETSEKWRRGWRRRTGEYAHLCDRCASAYEDGKFCETFHMNASGWRCCESCGKQIHCGCIVSFHMFVLLDAGGIECLTCAKKSYILTPNPAWPPPLHFLLSQPEKMKDLSVKTWNAIAGSGPVPWRQAPSLFNDATTQANDQLKMPFEVDVSGRIDWDSLCDIFSMASPERKQECSYERLANGKLRLGPPEILNGNIGLNVKEQHCPFTSDFKPIFPRNDTSSNLSWGVASSSKNEIDDAPVSAILSQSPSVAISMGKQVCGQRGMDSSGEAQICNWKSRGDGRSRNQLLPNPRYRPQITDEQLKQVCGQRGMDSSGEAQICNWKSRGDGRSRNQLLPRYRPQITDEQLKQVCGQKGMDSSGEAQTCNWKSRGDGRSRNQLLPRYCPQITDEQLKQVCGQKGMDSSGEAQICNWKSRGDGGSRNQLLPRYRPQITDEQLQQISGDSKTVITPLFEKMLSASDAGRIGRLVLPKKCAEAYFPPINHPEGLPLKVQDVKGKEWVFQFRFWPNNNSRMYVLEGITPCIQSMQLQAGDVVTFSRLEPEGKLIMGGRKASVVSSLDQGEEVNVIGSEASSPGDANARNKSSDVFSVNGHMREKILEDKPVIHVKRKNSNLNAKSKRLRIENEDMMELKLTYKEAQRLIRAPTKIVPSSFVVDGFEFEEFEECDPVIGRPTLLGIDHSGGKIQWVQCEDCFKWRKVPANALVPSEWTCSDNAWDLHRSVCSSAEELTNEQLEQMLPAMNKGPCNKEESSGWDVDLYVAVEGLDTLANLAIKGEGEGLVTYSENRTKHPRHRRGCTCIVCLQPPSGKGTKHQQSCDCVICTSLKHRFRTLMERREKKQVENETESPSSSQNFQGQQSSEEQDVDACVGSNTGNRSLNEEEVPNSCHLEEPNSRKLSTSPLKGQIDLNIQPEREEDFSPRSDCGAVKRSLPGSADRFFRQQQHRSLETDVIGNLVGKQDGVGCVNIINCVALDKKSG